MRCCVLTKFVPGAWTQQNSLRLDPQAKMIQLEIITVL